MAIGPDVGPKMPSGSSLIRAKPDSPPAFLLDCSTNNILAPTGALYVAMPLLVKDNNILLFSLGPLLQLHKSQQQYHCD